LEAADTPLTLQIITDMHIEPAVVEQWIERVGETHFRQRYSLQTDHSGELFGHGLKRFHIENATTINAAILLVLRMTGLYGWGRRNGLDIRVVERDMAVPALPRGFEGWRILHLSDLHLDVDPELTDAILQAIAPLQYDLAVITGDFRSLMHGPYERAMAESGRLIRALKAPAYGVLGNHDFLEFVPHLEAAGLRMLLNEMARLERAGDTIFLAGVDDPHFYETDNLQRARAGIPAAGFSILLAHTPEIARAAAAAGFQVMLCGHTHGGQICLPGGIAVMTNSHCERKLIRGGWRCAQMLGYTTTGVGSSGMLARFFCPPEAVIHTLRRAGTPDAGGRCKS
jgi:uncharacterized protein